MAKHVINSILFTMADTRLAVCLYQWPWTLHAYKWSFYWP